MAQLVVVVEDEAAIAEGVAARLRSEGFEVEIATDGPSGVALCEERRPDLVVLDVMLPGFDGFEVCRRIQQHRHVPVLMLTALDQETDLIVGLRIGADDYMTKPFSTRELVARVQAILRRVESAGTEAATPTYSLGDVELVVATRVVTRKGTPVHLTPTEFDLLARLMAADGTVLTREQLLAEVWGYAHGTGGRTVDSHVRSIRRKVGNDVIRTVHAVGYAIGSDA